MELNKSRKRVLWATAVLTKKLGYAPTTREICRALSVTSTSSVIGPLQQLKADDLVDWDAGKSRTLHLTPSGWSELVGRDLVKECARVSANILGRLRYLED